MAIRAAYSKALLARDFTADETQRAALERLQQMHEAFVAFKIRRSNRFKKLINRPEVPRGVWLFGGVGRGKSFLMDCFYGAVTVRRKMRVHFHEFMRGVHRDLDLLKGVANPLDEIARQIAQRFRLICFDEFHVSDIADAMILERLMRGLFENGVTFVITSNYEPDQLYPDGLHRDRVLPAIALLKQNLDLICVDAGVDYRMRSMQHVRTYHHPLGPEADAALSEAFNALAQPHDEEPILRIENREIQALRRSGGVVWFDFKTLCGGPRSQNDYLEIASQFHTVILSCVPQMSAAMSSEARRFVWLIDVLYDQKVNLLISAQCPAQELYTAGAMAGEFRRTVSRISEMQSREYLEAPRRGLGALQA
ncbi:MAG: cell division protein ZapE [Quisquiliibacterium sp.]